MADLAQSGWRGGEPLRTWEEGPRAEMVTLPWTGELLLLLEAGDRTV